MRFTRLSTQTQACCWHWRCCVDMLMPSTHLASDKAVKPERWWRSFLSHFISSWFKTTITTSFSSIFFAAAFLAPSMCQYWVCGQNTYRTQSLSVINKICDDCHRVRIVNYEWTWTHECLVFGLDVHYQHKFVAFVPFVPFHFAFFKANAQRPETNQRSCHHRCIWLVCI